MLAKTLSALAVMGALVPNPVRADAQLTDRDACDMALMFINTGLMPDTIASLQPPQPGDQERWQRDDRWGYVAGSYTLQLEGKPPLRLLAVEQGGTCHSQGLARDDGIELTFDRFVDDGESFGLDLLPFRLAAEPYVLAGWRNRWSFTPLALGRITDEGLRGLCRFAAQDQPLRLPQVEGLGDPACQAMIDGPPADLAWEGVSGDEVPQDGEMPVHDAQRAALDWLGDGKPHVTWKLQHESSAGCGMTYEWLALDASSEAGASVDRKTELGRALFPSVKGELFERGPWRIDRVFTLNKRAWLAAQPMWGAAKFGDYAVYRFDSDRAHVQCRYRLLPQFRIEKP